MILELSSTNTCFTVYFFFHGFVVFILWYRSGKERQTQQHSHTKLPLNLFFFGEGTDEI